MELNSTTLKGRANVAKLTLGGLAAVGIYFKMRGGSKSASPPFPYIKSTHSLVAKHVTPRSGPSSED